MEETNEYPGRDAETELWLEQFTIEIELQKYMLLDAHDFALCNVGRRD